MQLYQIHFYQKIVRKKVARVNAALKWLKFWIKKIFNKKQMFWQKFVLASLCKFDFQRLSYCTWLITYNNLIYFK